MKAKPTMCRNGLHQKPKKRGACVECLRAKEKRRNLLPGRQQAMNEAHKAWRKANPEAYAASQKAYWAREDVKERNRKRMRDVRAGKKAGRAEVAARLVEKADRLAKAWREKNTPDQYGITRKEAA